ncbi:hypothetical protein FB565_002601 [Actinoplanes lutulentus]|uniref:Uncharacterized protein n=1 Tax=Actinoplanes lutulentus TaxID=1287878 RepID=A0A327ZDJ1_9ACTN|nr:hypothetical protein [Actinoplanes lutulentus]MBB2942888.1 hypothetical protein [Actinoplanes lutulentus]RAK38466.1 hypothetical protein B0I29_105414 [Actinoplanes lutulentus]
MSQPVLRLDTHALTDDEAAVVGDLLHDLGVQGEELQPHLGVPEVLDALVVLSSDSMRVVFEAMLAAAGGAAAAKLGALLRKLPRRKVPGEDVEGQLVVSSDENGGFLVTREAAEDADAMAAMLHFDTGLLAPGDILVWDPESRKWRRRS